MRLLYSCRWHRGAARRRKASQALRGRRWCAARGTCAPETETKSRASARAASDLQGRTSSHERSGRQAVRLREHSREPGVETVVVRGDGLRTVLRWLLVRIGWGEENAVFRQMFTSLSSPKGMKEQIDWFKGL